MLHRSTQAKYRDLLLGLALMCAGGALIRFPTQSMQAGQQGLSLCFHVIVPSLFPFFVLSSLVVELGLVRYLGRAVERVMWPLFRVGGSGACALVLGFVGGYPIGARTVLSLYEKGLCSKTEAQRMLAFCNNSGPAFIFGVVGAGVFKNSTIGLLLFVAHITASICTGCLFRFYGSNDSKLAPPHTCAPQFQATRLSAAFTISVKNALSSVLNICAFVVVFTVIIRLLSLCGAMDFFSTLLSALLSPLHVSPTDAQRLLTGLLELSSGVTFLSAGGSLPGRVALAAFMLGWAGLSVHCQVLSFLSDSVLSAGTYLVGKALHAILSALFAFGLTRLFPLSQPTSTALSQPFHSRSALGALTIAIAVTGLLWLAFSLLRAHTVRRKKKRAGKRRRYAL